MPMVSIASFIVVPHDTNASHHAGQSVLASMPAAGQGALQAPNDEFDKRDFFQRQMLVDHWRGAHVVNGDNTAGCCHRDLQLVAAAVRGLASRLVVPDPLVSFDELLAADGSQPEPPD